jgi:O-antigen/teichoic acid export membrane protein
LNSNFNFYKTNKKRLHRLSKEGFWIIFGQILSILGGLVLLRVLTNQLEPSEFGDFSLSLTIAGLVSLVFFGGINNGISRYYSIANEKNDILGYINASTRLIRMVCYAVLILLIAVAIFFIFLKKYNWLWLTLSSILFAVFSSIGSALSGFQNAARQRVIVAWHSFLDAWLRVGLAIVFLVFIESSGLSVLLAYAISSVIVVISQFLFVNRNKRFYQTVEQNVNHDWQKKIWSFSWPFYATNLFGWAQQSSARWFLERYSTKVDVGFYSVISQLGYTPIQTLTALFITFLTPIFFSRVGDASSQQQNNNIKNLTNKLAISALVVISILVFIAVIFHSTIFSLLVNKKYLSVSGYLPLMLLSGGIFAVAQIYSIRLQSLFMMNKLVSSGIIISIAGVIFSFLGIKYAGIFGAVIGSLLFSLTYLSLMLYYFYKKS